MACCKQSLAHYGYWICGIRITPTMPHGFLFMNVSLLDGGCPWMSTYMYMYFQSCKLALSHTTSSSFWYDHSFLGFWTSVPFLPVDSWQRMHSSQSNVSLMTLQDMNCFFLTHVLVTERSNAKLNIATLVVLQAKILKISWKRILKKDEMH